MKQDFGVNSKPCFFIGVIIPIESLRRRNNYVCVYHNLMCLLHVVGILLDHYEQEEGHRETEMVLHIIKKNLEADKKELRDNNNEFDEYLIRQNGCE